MRHVQYVVPEDERGVPKRVAVTVADVTIFHLRPIACPKESLLEKSTASGFSTQALISLRFEAPDSAPLVGPGLRTTQIL